jgi:hypothetical protein
LLLPKNARKITPQCGYTSSVPCGTASLRREALLKNRTENKIMKQKKVYVCTECDYQSPKWLGKCPTCGSWNTFTEETYEEETTSSKKENSHRTMLVRSENDA